MKTKKIDNVDLAILTAIYKDSRLSNKDLAEKLGIAPSTSLERVKRLHKEGILQNYFAEIDYKSLGVNLQAMVSIRLDKHTQEKVEQFKKNILEAKEVISIYHMGGENDFLIHIAVNDVEHLRDFIYLAFSSQSGVEHISTALIYEHQRSRVLPYQL
ncbi:MAG: ArsR family transcriptional regulator [Gammaproteobacteria bacterium CG22_combo_CG10-13_8_21_14_all_40_8]|nr:MAG: ArsR family transcriptional regulator [Gammaproteobacteria bacterium CG22_combo_CG10-13_8_21_14_all_40_8]